MNQVHKGNLDRVENALPNRQGLDVEIFGMEGIPQDMFENHRNRIVQNFYQAQEDRRLATGNPLPGQARNQRKKIKIETAEELKRRLAEWRAKRHAAAASGVPMDSAEVSTMMISFPSLFAIRAAANVFFFSRALNQLDRPPTDTDRIRSLLDRPAASQEEPACHSVPVMRRLRLPRAARRKRTRRAGCSTTMRR